MDIVLIVLVVSIILVGLYFKNFRSVVYFIGILEIFFRLVNKINSLISLGEVNKVIKDYIPSSFEDIVNYYSSGILNTVLIWILILIFGYFEFYLIIYWKKKKK